MGRELTEKQQKFLDVLFTQAGGDPVQAKRIAGYSENTPTSYITDALSEEIFELTKKHLAVGAAKAAHFLVKAVSEGDNLVQRERLAAARDILDRAGITKTDKVEVKTNSPMFILPPKDRDDDDE